MQHLSFENNVTSSDKNIVTVWLKHIFISKFFAQQCTLRTHILKQDRDKSRILSILEVTYQYLHSQFPNSKIKISLEFAVLKDI